jgi:hypothetical protein
LVISVSSKNVAESLPVGPVGCSINVTQAKTLHLRPGTEVPLIDYFSKAKRTSFSIPCAGFDPSMRLIIDSRYLNTSSKVSTTVTPGWDRWAQKLWSILSFLFNGSTAPWGPRPSHFLRLHDHTF